ncbi:MAG: AmmeMemoRadiSam system protein A [Planctomycetes bacterium]|nr:AmmeMemoRadiSam system protein A [Planctomycetota bacterium]
MTKKEGALLLKIARQSLETFVKSGKRSKLPDKLPGALQMGYGAFVTLQVDQELRGCIGTMTAHGPLAETVREMAVAAGNNDPRFDPVPEEDLAAIQYEVSVLSPMKVTKAADVTPGKHGVMIRRGQYSGVLLPQVATEHGWDRESFLNHTCMKAGLPPGAWKEGGTDIYTFTAQVFSE